jgi:hypothetical protein
MLNQYGGYLPNTTLDQTFAGVPLVLQGNSGGPAFSFANNPFVCFHTPNKSGNSLHAWLHAACCSGLPALHAMLL